VSVLRSRLETRYSVVAVDTGQHCGLQREAYRMGTPCVTLRRETEWIETVEEGANIPVDPKGGASEPARAIGAHRPRWRNDRTWPRTTYRAGDAAERVVSALAPPVR
jgi:UDP-N-acetylglucosamine 2-epimerase